MNSSGASRADAGEIVGRTTDGMIGQRPFVVALADHAATRTTRRVVRALQKLTHCRLSGDDSGLANIWDEICAQAQFDQFDCWDVYEETGKGFLGGLVEGLSIHEKEAIWLQTEAGWDWDYDTRDANAECPLIEEEIVDYVWTEYVLAEAGRWTNARIRAYLERAGAVD